jgi:hypothetical protein
MLGLFRIKGLGCILSPKEGFGSFHSFFHGLWNAPVEFLNQLSWPDPMNET